MNTEIKFIKEIFDSFDYKDIPYCILRNVDEILLGNAHDIDLVIASAQYFEAVNLINEVCQRCQWLKHFEAERDGGNVVSIHLFKMNDYSPTIVHLDIHRAYGWDGYMLINSSLLLKDRNRNQWLWEASEEIQAVTMLFSRLLFHGYIKGKYRAYIHEIFLAKREKISEIMCQFLEKDFVDCICEEVISESWKSIEDNIPNIRKNVAERIEPSKRRRVAVRKKALMLKRLFGTIGVKVEVPIDVSMEYLNGLKEKLYRSFTNGEVCIVEYQVEGYNPLVNHVKLAKGYLLLVKSQKPKNPFDLTYTKESAEKDAYNILEYMSKRYL
jgi:hypothetical protein